MSADPSAADDAASDDLAILLREQYEAPDPPGGFRDELLATLQAELPTSSLPPAPPAARRSWTPALVAAALLLAALGVSWSQRERLPTLGRGDSGPLAQSKQARNPTSPDGSPSSDKLAGSQYGTADAHPGGVVDLTFDDIKFNVDSDLERGSEATFDRSLLTQRIRSLVGKKIRIRGFMLPTFQQEGLTEFVLVRDNLECCFGPGAKIHDAIIVRLDASQSARFQLRPVTVDGVFDIEELRIDGALLGLYQMKVANVE